jgi:hypothetical protein
MKILFHKIKLRICSGMLLLNDNDRILESACGELGANFFFPALGFELTLARLGNYL